MWNVELMKAVCAKHNLALHETKSGGFIVEFLPENGYSPLLATVDDGATWTPEAGKNFKNSWSGNISLIGSGLDTEIKAMYRELNLGLPNIMLKVARELQSMDDGKLFS